MTDDVSAATAETFVTNSEETLTRELFFFFPFFPQTRCVEETWTPPLLQTCEGGRKMHRMVETEVGKGQGQLGTWDAILRSFFFFFSRGCVRKKYNNSGVAEIETLNKEEETSWPTDTTKSISGKFSRSIFGVLPLATSDKKISNDNLFL